MADSVQRLRRVVEVGAALAGERDPRRLLAHILDEAMALTRADGGTLYLLDEGATALRFEILRNGTLGLAQGGPGEPAASLPAVSLLSPNGGANRANVASTAAIDRVTVQVADVYTTQAFDFSGTRAFDQRTGYRSRSFLAVPLIDRAGTLVGVLQLLNPVDEAGVPAPFDSDDQGIIEALAAQAAVAVQTQRLIDGQRQLWDALVRMIAGAIDDKSPYTGGHCQRVPVITEALVRAACAVKEGPFADFSMSAAEMYELHVAAWLHDCGKIVTPEHIVDKASKLETVHNRIHEVRTRFEVLRRDAEIACLRAQLAGTEKSVAEAAFAAEVAALEEAFAFVAHCNVGSEFLTDASVARLQEIGARSWTRHFDSRAGLSPREMVALADQPAPPTPGPEALLGDLPEHKQGPYDFGELYNLSIRRGTLTTEERHAIENHMVVGLKMLEGLPFPPELARVPALAGAHHERMDGRGYPRGLVGAQMSIPARAMAIADIFEALTAADRPYKPAKPLSEALRIMAKMRDEQHIDPDLFALFLTSGVWRTYAEAHLPPTRYDAIDIAALL
jgi:HD-GYP domain-containing protein (c-di-GMP phosphodiesterase class II)